MKNVKKMRACYEKVSSYALKKIFGRCKWKGKCKIVKLVMDRNRV